MPRIVLSGDSESASFNDDSSPDTRLTSDQKVSINAQLLPESSLDWYYRILQLCGSISGELKSSAVWPRFQGIHGENRDRIWAGLSKVRIHVVDPRPYRRSFDDVVREIFRCDDPVTFLRQRVALKDPSAAFVSREIQIFTAQEILSDSIGARIHSISNCVNDKLGISDGRGEVLHLSDFGPETKPIVRKVSAWAAKSAATFHEALDCVLDLEEEARFFPDQLIRRRMETRVLDTHTFDKGDEKQVALLEGARNSILENLKGYQTAEMAPTAPKPRPYTQSDSANSYLLQGADIAAGIASKILETQNLVAVVSSFEYVTYNGSRVSVSDAEEALRRIR